MIDRHPFDPDIARAAAAQSAWPIEGGGRIHGDDGYQPATPRTTNLLRELLQRPDWMADAHCRGLDPNLFYPTHRGDANPVAQATCNACPVRDQCRQYAIDNGERHGIWGGTTDKQRRATRRTQRVNRCGTNNGYQLHQYRHEPACDACKAAHARYRALRRQAGAA